ncbi:cation:proton antiporter [Aquabacterium sp. A3]|uniref:cation:proton antiporter n=1 Tax=Aquabacterium sp. A3 TaxID=3132829 RepID=UPI00311A6AFF
MHGAMPLIVTLAAALGLALVFGFVASRLKLPALVGYLLAGIVIGPHSPGFVADVNLAMQLAEIGVMLLMFGVGLHFSLDDLIAVRRIAVPGAVVQMGTATAMGAVLAWWWGWPWPAALLFGVALSVASTVVLLRALESRGAIDSVNGKIAVGWLVVEDLAMVLVLVMLPTVAAWSHGEGQAQDAWQTLLRTLLAVGAFLVVMLVAGRKVLPWVLLHISRTGSRELFTLGVMAAAVTIAYGSSALFGVSVALGAFFAGLVLRESEFSHRAAEESLPFRDAFAVLFFVSVGMLFDPAVLVDQPMHVLGVAAIIILGKSVAAAALVLAFRYPLNTALTVSVSLAQIGEFSFILAALGTSLGVLPAEAKSLIVAGAMLSIALNPLLFSLIEPVRQWVLQRSELARRLEAREDPLAELPITTHQRYLARQVVLVGYGGVGRRVAEALYAQRVPFVVVARSRAVVEDLRARGWAAVFGEAVEPATLIQAHIAHARQLVVTGHDAGEALIMLETARALNTDIVAVAQAGSDDEARWLRQAGYQQVFTGDDGLSAMLVQTVEMAPGASGASGSSGSA